MPQSPKPRHSSTPIDFAFDAEDFNVILTAGVPWSWCSLMRAGTPTTGMGGASSSWRHGRLRAVAIVGTGGLAPFSEWREHPHDHLRTSEGSSVIGHSVNPDCILVN